MFGGGIGMKYGLPRPDGLKAPLASQRAYILLSSDISKCLLKLLPTWSFGYPPKNPIILHPKMQVNLLINKYVMAISGATIRTLEKRLSMDFISRDHTICGWIKAYELVGRPEVIFGYCGGQGETQGSLMYDHTIQAFQQSYSLRNADDTFRVAKFDPLPLNQWCHLGIIYSDGKITVFLNGERGDEIETGSIVANEAFAVIGGSVNSDGHYLNNTRFHGEIAEVGFWSAKLTVDECISLSKGFRPSRVRPQSLEVYYPAIRTLNTATSGQTVITDGTVRAEDHPRVF